MVTCFSHPICSFALMSLSFRRLSKHTSALSTPISPLLAPQLALPYHISSFIVPQSSLLSPFNHLRSHLQPVSAFSSPHRPLSEPQSAPLSPICSHLSSPSGPFCQSAAAPPLNRPQSVPSELRRPFLGTQVSPLQSPVAPSYSTRQSPHTPNYY